MNLGGEGLAVLVVNGLHSCVFLAERVLKAAIVVSRVLSVRSSKGHRLGVDRSAVFA